MASGRVTRQIFPRRCPDCRAPRIDMPWTDPTTGEVHAGTVRHVPGYEVYVGSKASYTPDIAHLQGSPAARRAESASLDSDPDLPDNPTAALPASAGPTRHRGPGERKSAGCLGLAPEHGADAPAPQVDLTDADERASGLGGSAMRRSPLGGGEQGRRQAALPLSAAVVEIA